MKKAILLLTAISMTIIVSACGGAPTPATGIAQSSVRADSSTVSAPPLVDETPWACFVKDMEKQGIPYDDIHTLESSGITQSEIMTLSADEIKSKTETIKSTVTQNQRELMKSLLADFELAKNDPQFVYSDSNGTTSLDLVKNCVESIKLNDRAGFTGLMVGGVIPLAYEISYQPDGEILLASYHPSKDKDPEGVTSKITDIYESELFYQFSDQKNLYFSIPKVSLIDRIPHKEYQADSNLPNAAVSAAQAKEAAKNVYSQIYGYLKAAQENDLGNPINGYGIMIPADFKAPPADLSRFTLTAGEAADILGKPYYQVSFYADGESEGESYYIDAENAEKVFMVSMADGSLIPVCYQGAAHFRLT